MSIVTGAANPLDYLFKLSTQRKLPAPVFCQVVEDGPPHMKTFVWRCTFMQITAEGKGRSKKEAKTAAARAIKDGLDPESLPPEAPPSAHRKRKGEGKGGFPPSSHASPPFPESVSTKKRKKGPFPKKFGFGPGAFGPPPPPLGFHGKMSVDDHYVITKHKSIYPRDEELESILKVVSQVEESLRASSDELAESAAKEAKGPDAAAPSEEDKEEHRSIMGVARVGDLAKGLLLSSDRLVDIVIMCKEVPRPEDLSRLGALLRDKLKEAEAAYELSEVLEEAGFRVSLSTPAATVVARVTLTSSKVKEDGDGEEETEESKKVVAVPPPTNGGSELNRDRIEEALTELRRSNWFAGMAAGLPSCVECIRIIKEMARRDPSWACLSNWVIELLVERSLFSAHAPLSPSSSLLRVLEVISSGIFLDGGSGLKDPCEKEDVDVSSYLTPQQREDLTHSAQYFIRLITYRQINKVLGMDKLPPKGGKGGRYRNGTTREEGAVNTTPGGGPEEGEDKQSASS